MELVTFTRQLEEALPPDTAMNGDRIGVQIPNTHASVRILLVTMEVTDEVVQEAVRCGADTILSFHPLIFMPLTSLRADDRVGRITMELVRRDIALVVAHTNFDAFPRGTSTILAERLDLRVEKFLVPDAKREGFGMGVVAYSQEHLSPKELFMRLQSVCHSPLRFNEYYSQQRSAYDADVRIEKIAIVGGSGASFIGNALQAHADVFITADVKYHDFHRVQGQMILCDPGHYEMEQFVAQGLASVIETMTEKPERVMTSRVLTNPARYFPDDYHFIKRQHEFLSHE